MPEFPTSHAHCMQGLAILGNSAIQQDAFNGGKVDRLATQPHGTILPPLQTTLEVTITGPQPVISGNPATPHNTCRPGFIGLDQHVHADMCPRPCNPVQDFNLHILPKMRGNVEGHTLHDMGILAGD